MNIYEEQRTTHCDMFAVSSAIRCGLLEERQYGYDRDTA
jgi:hypothetical protein